MAKNRWFTRYFAATVLIVGLPIWLTKLEVARHSTDAALIAAIRRGDARAVRTLLARNADPNTHELPPPAAGRSWGGLLDDLRMALGPHSAPSALDQAVRLDMNARPHLLSPYYFMDSEKSPASAESAEPIRAIIEALIRKGANTEIDGRKASVELDQLQSRLARYPDQLPVSLAVEASDPGWQWRSICQDYEGNIRQYGGCCRAYAGMGECELRFNQYADASRSFGLALLWSPSDVTAHLGKDRAAALQDVARAVERLLAPSHRTVVAERPYPVATGTWAVLTKSDHGGKMRVGLYAVDHGRARQFARPLNLPDNHGPGRPPDEDLLFVYPVSGRTRPEIIVHRIIHTLEWEPSRLDLICLDRGRLVSLLGVEGNAPIRIEPSQHDRTCTVRTRCGVGERMSSIDRPPWPDIYAFKGGRFALSNQDYPHAFDGTMQELQRVSAAYPDDSDILLHIGMIEEYRRQPARALAVYRTARAACLRTIHSAFPPRHERAISATQAGVMLETIETRMRSLAGKSVK